MPSQPTQQALTASLRTANDTLPDGLKPWPPFTAVEMAVRRDIINSIDIADWQLSLGLFKTANITYAWQVELPLRCMLSGHFNPRRQGRSVKDGFLEAPAVADGDVTRLEALLQQQSSKTSRISVERVASDLAALSRVVEAFLGVEPDSAALQLAKSLCEEVACFLNTARKMAERGALTESTAQAMLQPMRDLTARAALQIRIAGFLEANR